MVGGIRISACYLFLGIFCFCSPFLYLIACCVDAAPHAYTRWAPAKLFHDQLSKLAESEQNIQHLSRLQDRIREGMALEV